MMTKFEQKKNSNWRYKTYYEYQFFEISDKYLSLSQFIFTELLVHPVNKCTYTNSLILGTQMYF